MLNEENIVRFPINIGLSGKTYMKGKVMVVAQGEMQNYYSSDIDNLHSIPRIHNMLLFPIIDLQGHVKGVLQLINKNKKKQIPLEDELEVEALTTALGEVVKTADTAMEIENVALDMDYYLNKLKQNINEKARVVESEGMALVSGSMQVIQDLVAELYEQKKKINDVQEKINLQVPI
mmetsp:Transcript_12143/g.11994  ORF Transcript_12143/g.11994 Transcript_12143/m.11994 type:complete len:177 (-) Transcript_12143:44-574(-)